MQFKWLTFDQYIDKAIDYGETILLSAGQSLGHGIGFTLGIFFIIKVLLWVNSKKK